MIEPWLAAEHLELDDLEMVGTGKTLTVRVLVDAEGGIDVDRLADVSNGLSRLLDPVDELQGPYRLEVSSPGLERTLRRPRHFEKAVGREVTVKVRRDDETRTVKGTITDADSDGFRLRTESGDEAFGYDSVVSAKTVFRWEKSPKPGQRKRREGV